LGSYQHQSFCVFSHKSSVKKMGFELPWGLIRCIPLRGRLPTPHLSDEKKCTHPAIFPKHSTSLSDTGLFIKWANFFGYSIPSFLYFTQRFCFMAWFQERHALGNIPWMRGLFRHWLSMRSVTLVMDDRNIGYH
jgi:hypothetical protein